MELQLCEDATPPELAGLPDWQAERKYDGIRGYTQGGRLLSRRGDDITDRFPEIDPPDAGWVFDGEVIATEGGKAAPFERTLQRVKTEKPFKIELLAERYPARLVVFDALVVDGQDIREKPLRERQRLAEQHLPTGAGMVAIGSYPDPSALWDQAQAEGWEGIIVKDPSAPYTGDRSETWLRVKDWSEGRFEIVNYEATDAGGFVAYVDIGNGDPQKVAVQDRTDREAIRRGAEAIEVQYLERSKNDRLRKPSCRGVVA